MDAFRVLSKTPATVHVRGDLTDSDLRGLEEFRATKLRR
jgi:hypothetical protein